MPDERPPFDLSRRVFLGGSLLGAAVAGAPARAAGAAETPLDFTLNGLPCATAAGGEETAVDVLRRRLQLTGTKEACGSGACGACTILVGGRPHAACVTPATALAGAEVRTIEGFGGTALADMHPVQRAFLAEDAVRCGACTPGFVVSAVAFYDRYRAAQRKDEPSREELGRVFAGHLCRCGAYDAILRGVTAACVGVHEARTSAIPVRPDALAKVSGQARYTADILLDGMVDAVLVRSPYAHARLVSLDEHAALDVEGVKRVLRILPDGGRVRYAGQEVAVVAGIDRRTAEAGARRVKAQWEVLPAATTMEGALARAAPLVFPARDESADAPVAGQRLPASWAGNLRGPVSTALGARPRRANLAVEEARAAGIVGEGVFRTAAQAAAPLEPHVAVARWTEEDKLELWASTEAVQELATEVATEYRLGAGRCTVVATYVGGGSGTKRHLTPEIRAAIDLAKILRAPVRIQLDRAEELRVGGARAPTQTELALAASPEGELQGIVSRTYSSAGAAVGNLCSQAARHLYATKAKDLDDYDVVTHTPPAVPMRAPGGPPLFFALETAVDHAARALSVDPLALRKRWDPDPVRQLLYDQAAALPWLRGERPPGVGIGIAAGAWPAEWDAGASVEVEVGPEGVLVRTGAQDAGEGTAGILAAVVAQRLGVTEGEVRVELGSSALVYGPPSIGGRTMSLVAAAERALDRLLEDLADLAAEKGGAVEQWRSLVAAGPPVRAIGRRGEKVREIGLPRPLAADPDVASVVTVVKVEVDPRLARVRVLSGWVGVGAGRIPSLSVARSQVVAAFVQNLGLALMEERRIDDLTGRTLQHDFVDYVVPGLADAPPVEVVFAEGGHEGVRGGALDVGEVAGVAVPAAIANAFFDATGRRPVRLPLTPKRVLELLA